MKILSALVAFAVGCGAIGTAGAAGADWHTYLNERYGTRIDYPSTFHPMPPPDANDGRKFKSTDGGEFSVFASYNALDFDLGGFRDFILKNLDAGSVVTYQASGDDWFVVSGTRGDRIFYQRHVLSHGGEMTEGFVISYPARLKQTYDPIVTRMAKSFQSGAGFQTPENR